MRMKKILLGSVLLLSSLGLRANTPDEGMWLPMLINKNYDEMKKIGFKLTADDIYNVNNSSLKDAIVSMGFCTGEMISSEGLMLTNHHCAYGSIQYNSSVEHDYLTNGFVAESRDKELSSPEVIASFLVRMEDVTVKILSETNGLPDAEKDAKQREIIKNLTSEATKGTHYQAIVRDVFGGNQFLMFVYERFPDVRLVYAPPSSVGKFGGDTDNWMWPRHTGDFSIFRVYMGKDGKPAPYSKDNVPYKPKRHLSISMKGVKEGDFAMIMGYPGRTNRYAFSKEMQNAVDRANPAIVKLIGKRLEVMKADMDLNAGTRIKLADSYASAANTWKYYIGQNEGLIKLDVIAGKKAVEDNFVKWANANATTKEKYSSVMTNVDAIFDEYKPYALRSSYYSLAGMSSVSVGYASRLTALNTALTKTPSDQDAIKKEVDKLKPQLEELYKDYVPTTDQKVFAELLTLYYYDIPKEQQPSVLAEIINKYKAKTIKASFEKFAADAFKKSVVTSKEKMEAFLNAPSAKKLAADPLFDYVTKMNEYRNSFIANITKFNTALAKEKKAYIAGLMEMNPNQLMYPDANSTMRITYGKVAGYTGKDATVYNYYTTSRGLLEKYIPNDQEFDIPAKLVDLLKKKDFGIYVNEKGELPVGFLTDNDITGGNSGSPVINANGELIGTAFDGNWEAMTGDLVFDKTFKRTIVCDIRYALFIMDKYSGASHIIKEMTLVK